MTKPNPLGIAPFDAAEYLTDEESIAEFLNASLEIGDPSVLMNAVNTVARVRGMSHLAEASGLGRESLYKALRPGAQPRYETVMKVIRALGVAMIFQPAQPHATKSKSRTRTRTARGGHEEIAAGAKGDGSRHCEDDREVRSPSTPTATFPRRAQPPCRT